MSAYGASAAVVQVLVAAIVKDPSCQVWSVPIMTTAEEQLSQSLVQVHDLVLPAGHSEQAWKPAIFSPQGQLVPPGVVGDLYLFPCKTGVASCLGEHRLLDRRWRSCCVCCLS